MISRRIWYRNDRKNFAATLHRTIGRPEALSSRPPKNFYKKAGWRAMKPAEKRFATSGFQHVVPPGCLSYKVTHPLHVQPRLQQPIYRHLERCAQTVFGEKNSAVPPTCQCTSFPRHSPPGIMPDPDEPLCRQQLAADRTQYIINGGHPEHNQAVSLNLLDIHFSFHHNF